MPVVVAGQRAARRRDHRELRGAHVRDLLRHPGRARPPALPRRRLRPARLRSLPRPLTRGDGRAARARRAGRGRRARRGVPRPQRLRAPPRRRPARQGCRDRGDRPRLLDRDRAQQARGQGGLRRREAGRLRRAHREQARERFAARRPGSSPASARRPRNGSNGRASARLRALGGDARRALDGMVRRRGSARTSAAWRVSRTSATSERSASRSRSRARPPSTATCAASGARATAATPHRAALLRRSPAQQRRGRTDRHQGAIRRLLDRHPGAHASIAVNELEPVWQMALDLLRRLDPTQPVRLIGVRVAGLDEEAARRRDQLRSPLR